MSSISLTENPVLKGELEIPGDKSISHRALLFSALSLGESHYEHFLESEDCVHTLRALQAMGVEIDYVPGSGQIHVRGVGMNGLQAPDKDLDMGNSGTAMRLLLGVLAGQKFEATLFGDESLSSRPMNRVTLPLKKMGAQIKGAEKGNFAPLTIRGGKLQGIRFENKLRSAQVKSALLFAGMQAEGETVIIEDVPSRDHTERFLEAAGASFKQADGVLTVSKTLELKPLSFRIPGDISSAAFFMVGAAMKEGSTVKLKNVGLNPTRDGILRVLRRMGADISINVKAEIPEIAGDITIRGTRLKGTRIVGEEIPSLIDELPVLMIAMALAEGESLISGAEELRVKESDRISTMAQNLNAIGGKMDELPDGCIIRGVDRFQGGEVQSFGDHRIAMSFIIASLCSEGEVVIQNTDCMNTSYPSFLEHFRLLSSE